MIHSTNISWVAYNDNLVLGGLRVRIKKNELLVKDAEDSNPFFGGEGVREIGKHGSLTDD